MKLKKKEAIIKLVWHSQEILAQYFVFLTLLYGIPDFQIHEKVI